MHLIRQKSKNSSCQWEYLNKIRQAGLIKAPDEVETGGYYLYKEKHGMVALVKVINKNALNGWNNFTLEVKRVLFSPWEVRKGTVFEVGLDLNYTSYPGAWHFERGIAVVKAEPQKVHVVNKPQEASRESVL